jgi:integrase
VSRIKLKYVNAVHKAGKTYYYFRRPGCRRTPLPGLPGSETFMAAYSAAMSETKIEIGSDRTLPGTVNALIVAFYKSDTFTKNEPITQQTDRNIIEAFRRKHGDKPVALMEQRHVEKVLEEKAGRPAAKRNLLRVLRVLLGFAVKQRMRKDNPALGIKLESYTTEGYPTWTDAEIAQFEQHHPVGTKARLAFALLLWTCQRRKDAVRLGSSNVVMRDGEQRLQLTQSKHKAGIDMPLAPPLAEIIAVTPMVGVRTFLVTDYGKPFTAAGFGNWFRDQCNMAGLPHLSAHGLRKAFLRRGAELGWSEDYLASFSGHKNMDMIRIYVRAANKARMADDAMRQMVARFGDKAGRGTK